MGRFKRTAWKHVYYLGWNRSPAQVGCMRQVLGAGALGRPRGIRWRGRWEGRSGWGKKEKNKNKKKKESTCQYKRHGSISDPGRYPTCHVAFRATKPMHSNSWPHALEPESWNYWSPHSREPVFQTRQATAVISLRTATREKPMRQRRPSRVKNKEINKIIKY